MGSQPIRIQLGKILQENLAGNSCRKMLQEILAGKCCGTGWRGKSQFKKGSDWWKFSIWNRVMGSQPIRIQLGKNLAGKILQENLAGKSCGKILRENLVGKSCRKFLRENPAGKSCGVATCLYLYLFCICFRLSLVELQHVCICICSVSVLSKKLRLVYSSH